MTKVIALANGRGQAIVDDADYALLAQYSWRLHSKGYAIRSWRVNGVNYSQYMHQLVLGVPPMAGLRPDHINGNRLDNRRDNLRWATNQQNAANKAKRAGTSSRYKGVTWLPRQRRWVAQIMVDGTRLHLGLFVNEVEAALAYDVAAMEHFGPYAKVNFPAEVLK